MVENEIDKIVPQSQEKIAVVTGSAGIGLGVALRLVEGGFGVVLCGFNEEHNNAARTAGASKPIEVIKLDVSDAAAVATFAKELSSRFTCLDALVNCAAIQPYGNIETTLPNDWTKVIGTNLTGYYLMSHYLYPLLKSGNSGSIVHLASVQGHSNQNNVLGYATSKGAIHALTRAMAVDCAKDGVRVNSISPGSVRTPLLEMAAHELTEEGGDFEKTLAEFGKSHPIGRVGTVEEIAALVAYLVGPDSGFCVGGDFPIDGGLGAMLGV